MHKSLIAVDDLLSDHQLYHSEFQQDRFITIKNGGTAYGCYKQALRELHRRKQSLRDISYQLEELNIDCDEISEKIQKCEEGTAEYRRLNLELSRKSDQMNDAESTKAELEREFNRFHQQASALKAEIGELTDERRRQLEAEFWEYRIKQMLAVEFSVYGRPDSDTLQLLQCLPPDMRGRLVQRIASAEEAKRLASEYLDAPEVRLIPD